MTCTDLSVLATTNYPEKWWETNQHAYWYIVNKNHIVSRIMAASLPRESIATKVWVCLCFIWSNLPFTPRKALRLLLHTLSTSASRYGRYIEPLLSLSIDFYVRVFVRIQTSPMEVKKSLACVVFYDVRQLVNLTLFRVQEELYLLHLHNMPIALRAALRQDDHEDLRFRKREL